MSDCILRYGLRLLYLFFIAAYGRGAPTVQRTSAREPARQAERKLYGFDRSWDINRESCFLCASCSYP
ncbi:hypothetical protein QSI_1398 [Clostridioides difficile P28]|nr:hypothetical protein QSI_1398 [Clostridioides difficile P28]